VRQLWFLDLERAPVYQVWAGDYDVFIAWAWDSNSRFTYVQDLQTGLIRIDADAASGGEVIYEGDENLEVGGVLDGRLLIGRFNLGGDLWRVDENDLAGANSIEEVGSLLVPLEGSEGFPSLSPDQRWLSYSSNATGRTEVYVLAYPVEEAPRPLRLSTDGGEEAVWSPRGDGLYFRDARRWYWVPLTDSEQQPFGEPELFAEGEYLNLPGLEYAVSADGSRLLVVRSVGEPTTTTLNVITNFFEVLEERVPN
jgi:Tol biopolymer transport system component